MDKDSGVVPVEEIIDPTTSYRITSGSHVVADCAVRADVR